MNIVDINCLTFWLTLELKKDFFLFFVFLKFLSNLPKKDFQEYGVGYSKEILKSKGSKKKRFNDLILCIYTVYFMCIYDVVSIHILKVILTFYVIKEIKKISEKVKKKKKKRYVPRNT